MWCASEREIEGGGTQAASERDRGWRYTSSKREYEGTQAASGRVSNGAAINEGALLTNAIFPPRLSPRGSPQLGPSSGPSAGERKGANRGAWSRVSCRFDYVLPSDPTTTLSSPLLSLFFFPLYWEMQEGIMVTTIPLQLAVWKLGRCIQ